MIAVETLRHMLADELEHVGRALLNSVRVDRSGELRGEDRNGELWILQLRGTKKGICLNATTMKGCNAFDFVRVAAGEQSVPAACRTAERLLGLSDHEPERLPRLAAEARAAQAEAAERREAEEERRTARVAERAREWKAGAEIGAKTPAGLYLAGRFCFADDLHSNLRSADNGSSSTLLAGMLNTNLAEVTAYHETSLALQGDGWRKRGGKAKLVFGKAGGTIIPLALGPAGTLVLSEGIENGLTAHLLLPGVAAAAAYSVGNLRAGLAAKWDRILLVRDREANIRSHGPACRAAAIAYWWGQGRAVTCLDPPEGYPDLNAAAIALRGQRNRPARPADEVWAEAGPLDTVPDVAEWCHAHGLGDGPHLLRAHVGIEANGRRHPALLAQLVQPDGCATGLVARLLPSKPLVHPWREWGERAGTVVAIRPPKGETGRPAVGLAVGLETALAAGATWAALGLDHLAEAAVAASAWSLDLHPGAIPTLADDVLMWREGLRRLHPGRELRVVLPAPAEKETAEQAEAGLAA